MPAQTLDIDRAADTLRQAGLDEEAVKAKAVSLNALHATLARINDGPARAYFVPGRIEVLGKHVDYAGGQSMTCATEQGFCLVAAPRDDWRVRLVDPVNKLEASLPLDPELEPFAADWTTYAVTVARRLARDFVPDRPGHLAGCDIAFASDLPQAAGLSSSSALITGLFLAIAETNRLAQLPAFTDEITTDLDLAGYLGCVENGSGFGTLAGDRGVGTKGGSQDHTAILCGRAGMISRFSYRPVSLVDRTPMPPDHVFVVGISGVHAVKTGNAQDRYNRAAELAGEAVEHWRKQTGRDDEHLAAAAAAWPDAPERLQACFVDAPEPLRLRVEQFLDESTRIVPAACDALSGGDLDSFGELADASQRGAETMLGNQVPQTIHLARSAHELGAVAASAFGAGFGGSVWALVASDDADGFTQRWSDAYRKAFGDDAPNAAFITTRPAPPAMRL